MLKIHWYDYIKWPQTRKDAYPFVLLDKNNEAKLYELAEKAKYKAALARKQKNE